MNSVPSGWAEATVGEVGEVMLGRQRSPRYHSGSHMRPYLRVKNVFENRIDLTDVMEMDFPPADYERYRLESGDILLNEGQSPELVGRPAMYRGELPGACFTNSLIRFQPYVGIDRQYSLYLFLHHLWSGRFRREARITTNIAHLSATRFSSVEFPVPPLDEQRRIVAAIEEHFSRLDAAQSSLRAALRRLDMLHRGVRASLDQLEGAPMRLGELLKDAPVFTDGDWVESKDQDPRGDVRLIQLADVGDGTFRDRSNRFLTSATATRLRCTYLEPGDVLVARMPDPLGRACVFPGVGQPSVTAVDVCIIRPSSWIHSPWLMHALNAPAVRDLILALQSGTTRKRISRKNLATVTLLVPPLETQQRIATEVEQRLSAVDALRSALERTQRRSRSLRRAVLERAFRGELVSQDPSDEPASVLLERIRAERAAAPRQTRRRRVGA